MREYCPSDVCPMITQSFLIMRLLIFTVLLLLLCTIETKKVKKEKKAVEEGIHQVRYHSQFFVNLVLCVHNKTYKKFDAHCSKKCDNSSQEEAHDGPFAHSSFVRPRQLLRQSKYEKCKADCARIKEQEDMQTVRS